ncbi:hypothetical protein KO465_01605 [Candidatus Micrarchaeota archaeon]|nr:hypothetical protein [Candidatus Micrarchaeota archaeon]
MKKIIALLIIGFLVLGCIGNGDNGGKPVDDDNQTIEDPNNDGEDNDTDVDIGNDTDQDFIDDVEIVIDDIDEPDEIIVVDDPNAELNVRFFNVGYASSALISKGDVNILVDAGDPTSGTRIVDKIKSIGVNKIDVMIITNPSDRKISGASYVLDNFQVGEVWDNGASTENYDKVKTKIKEMGIETKTIRAGNSFVYNGMNLDFYNPDEENIQPNNPNINSLVFVLKDRSFSVMFTSDLENNELRKLLTNQPTLYSNIVEIPRNGKSAIRELSSSTQEIVRLIDATRPDAMILSVGPNSDKAPSPQLITAIETQGVKIYRTDTAGNILITYNLGKGYEIYENN